MNKDIFSNLVCRSMACPLRLEKKDGVTWLIPIKGPSGSSYYVDLLSMSNDILMDFLKLGELLKNELTEQKYAPLFLPDETIKLAQQAGRGKAKYESLIPAFEDNKSPFLQKNTDRVAHEIMQFFGKYGVLRSSHLNIDSLPGRIMEYIAEAAFGPDLQPESFSNITFPISFLAYFIFELYFRYTNPQEYCEAAHLSPPKSIPAEVVKHLRPQFMVSITLNVFYTENDGWHEQKNLESLFDLISLLLFYKDDVMVRKCQYCGNIYVTHLDSSVYCSPSCRNRANSKKSYERRKAREALQGQGTK